MNRAMKKAHALAERTDFHLRSTMKIFNRSVKIVHHDGTFVFYSNAFLMKRVEDKQLLIIAFTEHQGFHVFHASDLQSYRQYDACIPAEECKCPDECVFHPVEKEENKDVHTEHCCQRHGCKYSDSDCPVETGKKHQSHPCEMCDNSVYDDYDEV